MNKYIGMDTETLKEYRYRKIKELAEGVEIWASLFGNNFVKVVCGIVVDAI